MVKSLRNPAMFQRVFLEFGTLSWPYGFDHDSISLHDRMVEVGELTPVTVE